MIKKLIRKLFARDSDPVYSCEVYTNIGCAHVDGFLCDMSTCEILQKYKAENTMCPVCGYYCLGKGGDGCIDKPSLVSEYGSIKR